MNRPVGSGGCGAPEKLPAIKKQAKSKTAQLKTAEVEAMQQRLAELSLYQDKIDGRAGMLTRAALGAYQKANGLKLDCWPTAAVLSIRCAPQKT